MATNATVEPRRVGVDWTSAILAGVAGGAILLILEMVLTPVVLGMSPWAPVRMIAAIAMGQRVVPVPGETPVFDWSITIVALVVHLALSIVYAVIFALIMGRWGMGMLILAGAVFGLVLYLINFYLFTTLFPWFAMARNWVSVVSHLVYGTVLAWTYVSLRSRRMVFPAP